MKNNICVILVHVVSFISLHSLENSSLLLLAPLIDLAIGKAPPIRLWSPGPSVSRSLTDPRSDVLAEDRATEILYLESACRIGWRMSF